MAPSNPRWYESITVRLAFEEDVNTRTGMSDRIRWIGWLSETRPIPRSPDGDDKVEVSQSQRCDY